MAATEKQKEYTRNYYKANREGKLKYSREFYVANREEKLAYAHMYKLKKKYGITVGEYEAILEGQGGVCGICGWSPVGKRRLAVDHNHKTGEIRGLLCISCNRGLPYFRDNPRSLRNASTYLLNTLSHV